MRGRSIRTRAKLLPRPDVTHDEPRFGHGRQFSGFQIQILIRHFVVDGVHEETAKRLHLADRDPLARTTVVPVVIATALRNELVGSDLPIVKPLGPELLRRVPRTSVGIRAVEGVVCGRGRNPTLRLWPTIFSGKIDVFPGDRRSRLISSMTSVAPA